MTQALPPAQLVDDNRWRHLRPGARGRPGTDRVAHKRNEVPKARAEAQRAGLRTLLDHPHSILPAPPSRLPPSHLPLPNPPCPMPVLSNDRPLPSRSVLAGWWSLDKG